MNHVNIFTHTSVRAPIPQKGKVIVLLESVVNGEPYTKTFIEEVEGNWNDTALEAVRLGLSKLKAPAELVIWTDCPYIELNIERAKEWQQNNFEKNGEKRSHWKKWQAILNLLKDSKYKVTSGTNAYTSWLISELKKGE